MDEKGLKNSRYEPHIAR